MPQSLRGKSALALAMMALIIIGGGIVAIYSLHFTAETSGNLAEERLQRLEDAQKLLHRTLLIEHQSHLLLTGIPEDVQENYTRIIALLDSLDRLGARFSQTNNSTAISDLRQASQLFRNTVHTIAQLRTDDVPPANVTTPRMDEHQQTLNRFQQELENQAVAIATAAEDVSNRITDDYRQAVVNLAVTTRHRQQFVLATLIATLFLVWLVSRHFRTHAVHRLQQVSHYLRLGTTEENNVSVPVGGDDEIGEMARAVERFREEHYRLAETQKQLTEHEEMMRTITNGVQSGVMLIDEKDIIRFANPAAERLFGYDHGELDGSKAHEVLAPSALYGQARKGLAEFARSGAGPVLKKPQELVARRKDGGEVFIELYVGRIRRGEHWWAVGSAIDISEHKSREEKLANQAETDPLTGVKNRRSFMQLAEDALKRNRGLETPLFFLMFDLDHFKNVNDTYGHAIGDEVLREFAAVCVRNLRDTDLFARIGGEEFAAVMPCKDIQTVAGIAERIRLSFTNITVQVGQKQLMIDTSVSIGLVCVDPARDNVESGLEKADAAMYQAKTQGRNRVIAN